jgi:hypothetical protein
MTPHATATTDDGHPARRSTRLAAILLGVGGLSLVGAGALLWAREGAAVFIESTLIAALAWCF